MDQGMGKVQAIKAVFFLFFTRATLQVFLVLVL